MVSNILIETGPNPRTRTVVARIKYTDFDSNDNYNSDGCKQAYFNFMENKFGQEYKDAYNAYHNEKQM